MDDEAYFEKFRKFWEDLAAGKTNFYKCPMPNGKELGECTGDEMSKMAEFFKDKKKEAREKMQECSNMIEFLSNPDVKKK